jgi:hypothetical protein
VKRKVWTRKAVEALGVRTDVPTAYEILTGRGRDAAYRAVKRGEFPVPVVPVGDHQLIVPVQPILDLLGISPRKQAAGASAAPAAITADTLAKDVDNAHGTTAA